jgi:hypothetical protein
MASTTKVDQAARAKARERCIALDKDRQARDARIEAGAAEVFAGVAARESAKAQVKAAEDTMATGLVALMKEGLTTVQVAELCELTVSEVQKLTKKRHRAGGPAREVGTTTVTKVSGAGTGTRQPGSENVA